MCQCNLKPQAQVVQVAFEALRLTAILTGSESRPTTGTASTSPLLLRLVLVTHSGWHCSTGRHCTVTAVAQPESASGSATGSASASAYWQPEATRPLPVVVLPAAVPRRPGPPAPAATAARARRGLASDSDSTRSHDVQVLISLA